MQIAQAETNNDILVKKIEYLAQIDNSYNVLIDTVLKKAEEKIQVKKINENEKISYKEY